jgi:hypothetical protein
MEVSEIKLCEEYKLVKVWIKKGKKSGVPIGVRIIKFGEIPTKNSPLIGIRKSEGLSGEDKNTKYNLSTNVISVKPLNGTGLLIETQTSVFLLLPI